VKGNHLMTKSSKKAKKQTDGAPKAWIKLNTGVKLIALTSIAMAVITGITTVPALGLVEGLAWAIGFGAAIWLIFYGMMAVQRFLHR
jgi:uncharacterized membrane-anchored protein